MNTARENAKKELENALTADNATYDESRAAFAKWEGLTSGRRPGYYKAQQAVIEELHADRAVGTKAERPAKVATPEGGVIEVEPARGVETGDALVANAKRQVESVKPQAGAFIKQRRVARRSGTVVTIYDLSAATEAQATHWSGIATSDGKPGKYPVQCDEHGGHMVASSYEKAWRAALDPATFCTGCKTAKA